MCDDDRGGMTCIAWFWIFGGDLKERSEKGLAGKGKDRWHEKKGHTGVSPAVGLTGNWERRN